MGNSENEITKRNSSIELLKIIAIIMIIISHSLPSTNYQIEGTVFELGVASSNITNIILVFLKYLGGIGDCIFIVCSAWFLLDNSKNNGKKIIKFIIDSFVISNIILILFILIGKNDMSFMDNFKYIFPFTSGLNWFLTCYVLFYLIHIFLNTIIKNINKKQHFQIIVLIFIYFILKNISPMNLYFNEFTGFISIYFIVAYMKLYMNEFCRKIKSNKRILLLSVFFLVLLICITNIAGLFLNIFNNKLLMWNGFMNPIIILIALSCFNIFNNKKKYCKLINKCSSLSFFIYLIHANPLINDNLKSVYYEYMPQNHMSTLSSVVLLAIIFFIGSIIVSMIYKKTIGLFTDRIAKKAMMFFEKTINKTYNIINYFVDFIEND